VTLENFLTFLSPNGTKLPNGLLVCVLVRGCSAFSNERREQAQSLLSARHPLHHNHNHNSNNTTTTPPSAATPPLLAPRANASVSRCLCVERPCTVLFSPGWLSCILNRCGKDGTASWQKLRYLLHHFFNLLHSHFGNLQPI
jgi:hypothetical protein